MVLRYDADGGVAVITFDRPDVLNAFDDELGRATLQAVRDAADDAALRCVVLTGAGRAFSAGEDLGALAASYERGEPPALDRILSERYNPLIRALREAPKPVIAALNGVAAGAGASVALACDVRIASDRAKLALPFARVGLVPDSGALWLLARLVGTGRAWEIVTSGRTIDATDALALGLVHEVASAEDFDGRWRAAARMFAEGPPRALAATKRLLNGALERSLDDQLELEVEAQGEVGRSDDHVEGVRAFLEKRAPRFSGT